jgi:hypothetical protein
MKILWSALLLILLATPATADLLALGVLVPCNHAASEVVAAELDGQPGVDLATAADYEGTVSILRNLGDGTFAEPVMITVEPGAMHYSLCAADIDGDFDNDLIVARGATISILVNDGAAGFTPGETLPTNGQDAKREICAGDIDGDQDVDVLWGTPTLGGGLWLAVNEGGTFATPVELLHSHVDDPALAYLNDDPYLDLVFDRNVRSEIGVLLGRGDGTFEPLATYVTPHASADLAAADLDGDGDLDLALIQRTTGYPTLYKLTNDGDGIFGDAVDIGSGDLGAIGIIAPDLTGSGCGDAVPICASAVRFFWLNDCTCPETFEQIFPSIQTSDATAADLDRDGDLDLVYAAPTANSIIVHFNNRLQYTGAPHESPRATGGLMIESLHPNPFNPRTTVSYALPAAGNATLTIHDARGVEVTRLVDGSMAAGAHAVDWTGVDAVGRALPSGTYFCRLATPWGVETRKMSLIR